MKDRIAQIMQKEEMTAGQFAEKIGISPSSLSHILSGRNNPSLEVVTKIHKACNYVNLFWLLYGDGEMEGPAQTVTSENSPISGISLFDESAFLRPRGRMNEKIARKSHQKALFLPLKRLCVRRLSTLKSLQEKSLK